MRKLASESSAFAVAGSESFAAAGSAGAVAPASWLVLPELAAAALLLESGSAAALAEGEGDAAGCAVEAGAPRLAGANGKRGAA